MAHYIDKDALEAKIKEMLDYKENEKTKWYNNCPNNPRLDGEIAAIKGINYILKNIDVIELDLKSSAEWSEEDEAKKEKLISIVKRALHGNEYRLLNDNGATELITWLKHLRPRPHWKPSEEQMAALEGVIGRKTINSVSNAGTVLKSLYRDLKKL